MPSSENIRYFKRDRCHTGSRIQPRWPSSRRGIEPHIWNSARNASVIARNIYAALSELDSANEPYYKHRLDSLQQIIAQTDTEVRNRLQNADTTFLIYHPALSYFARDYGLKQISIEERGKEPSPAHLKELIETCRRDNARVIFVQQEFDTRNARLIADELGDYRCSHQSAKLRMAGRDD